jgi:flagellar protein FliS
MSAHAGAVFPATTTLRLPADRAMSTSGSRCIENDDLESGEYRVSMTNPYEAYKKTQAQTATKGDLLLMLYDGAVRYALRARAAIESRDITAANNSIQRVEGIISELSVTLDRESSPEIADCLARLYEYMMHLLIQANIRKSVEPLDEVISMLMDLRDTWRQAARRASGEPGEAGLGLSFSAANA